MMTTSRVISTLAALVTVALTGVACSEPGDPSPTGPREGSNVTTVRVVPTADTVKAGETAQLEAQTLNKAGNPVNAPVSWNSRNWTVATVRSSGTVVGQDIGQTEIVAEAEGSKGTATITVLAPPIAEVDLPDAVDTLDVGEWVESEATLRDSSGNIISTKPSWSSRKPSVATVDSTGRITGQATGEATVVATAESGASDSLTVSVRQIASDLAVQDVELLPRGVLVDSTTRAQIILINSGGHMDERVNWRLTTDDGRLLASGTATPPRRGRTDTVSVENVGGLEIGRHRVVATLDPDQDADRTNNTADDWLRVRSRGFDIKLVFGDDVSEARQDTARKAANRWEEIVTGDLPDVSGNLGRSACFPAGVNEPVDDVIIRVVRDPDLDPAGNALPCDIRNRDDFEVPGLPITGRVKYDPDFNYPGPLFLHEIGHVLGLVGNENVIHKQPEEDLKAEFDGEWFYLGPMGLEEYHRMGGSDNRVPLRGPSHWSAYLFDSRTTDVMASGTAMIVSRLSVAVLADLGYAVNVGAADEVEPGDHFRH